MKRLFTVVAIAAGLSVATASPAGAGGWAVTTLDPMTTPASGEPIEVGFTIRQHGVTPVAVDGVEILVRDAEGATGHFAAKGAGPAGHYIASVTFPGAGQFRWSVVQGWFGPQELGTVQIEPAAAPAGPTAGRWTLVWRLVLPLVAVILMIAAVVDLRRWTPAAA